MTSITRNTTYVVRPAGNRTSDPRIRRPVLYPAELRAQSLHLKSNGRSPGETTNECCSPNGVLCGFVVWGSSCCRTKEGWTFDRIRPENCCAR